MKIINIRHDIKFGIVYEDDFIIVIDKPAGILIHSDGTGANCLTAAIEDYLKISAGMATAKKAYHTHRLDKGTSGLILYAKDRDTCALLDRALFKNLISRYYTAICEGRLAKREGVINLPIGRDRHDSRKYRVSKTGKPAVTEYKVLNYIKNENLSVIEARLETGRTHQIRVHFSHKEHPLAGDILYGAKPLKNDCGRNFLLHSSFLRFEHPHSKKIIILHSEADFIKNLKLYINKSTVLNKV